MNTTSGSLQPLFFLQIFPCSPFQIQDSFFNYLCVCVHAHAHMLTCANLYAALNIFNITLFTYPGLTTWN